MVLLFSGHINISDVIVNTISHTEVSIILNISSSEQ